MVFFLAAMPFAFGQTQVDLATQSKNVDFSRAPSTKPAQVGPLVPGICSTGQIFFDSSAAAGQNLYGCTATNVWSLLGGTGGGSGGSAGTASQLGDFIANDTSAAVQTLGAGCSTATPCQIRIGTASFVMTAPVTATLSGTSNNATVFWYLSSSQILTLGHNSGTTITCSSGCTVVTGITTFPPDSVPLWQTTFTTNIWDPINFSTMDKRAIYSRDVIAVGTGMSSISNPSTGVQTLSTDPTQVPRYFTGSGGPIGPCSAGRDFYTDTTGLNLYFCDAANTWKQANSAGGGTVTDSSYRYIPTASGFPNFGSGNGVGGGWVWDGTAVGSVGNGSAGLQIAPSGGTHYAWTSFPVPVGWTGAVNLLANYMLTVSASGTGTGTHSYSLSCVIPGTTNISTSPPVFSATTTVSFNVTTAGVIQADAPVFSSVPACNPGTLTAPTGALLLIRVVRAATGTATDPTILLGFNVALPHTVQ